MTERRTPRPSNYHANTVTVTPALVCGGSPDRRALLISTTTADVYLSPDPAIVAPRGLRITAGQPPVEICACHQGQFVCMPLYGTTLAGTAIVYVIEGFEDQWPRNANR